MTTKETLFKRANPILRRICVRFEQLVSDLVCMSLHGLCQEHGYAV